MRTRIKIIYILLSFIFSCERVSLANTDLSFITYIIRSSFQNFNGASNSTGIPKVVSTDFIVNTTLAPVVISKTQILGVTFDIPMSMTGCTVTINGNAIATSVTTSTDKKTLLFKPTTAWDVNLLNLQNLEISSNCKSESGIAYVPGSGVSVYIADSLLYVDSTAGNDGNPGTMQSPMKSLQAAITTISPSCTGSISCALAIKGGSYTISSSLTISSNISFFGGFDPADWKSRRADKTSLPPYDTILVDSSVNVTGTVSSPYSSIQFLNNSGTSVLDGIIVNGPNSATGGSLVSPISLVGLTSTGNISIRNTVFKDLSSTANVISAGLISYNNSGKISLTNNQVLASTTVTSPSERHGIYYNISNAGSNISVTTTDINAGNSTVNSSGFHSTGTLNGTVSLTSNTIIGSACTACNSVGVTANFAVANGFSISQNTITSGSGSNSYGINFTAGSGLTVSNNIINSGSCNVASCTSAGIQEISPASNSTISNNTITGGSCTGAPCNSAGLYLAAPGTHTYTGNTITSSLCNSASCITTGIFDNAQATLTFNNNTISSGPCSGNACDTRGYYLSHAFNTLSSTVTFSNNIISSGTCSGTSCKAFGFSTTNSMGATIIYNFTGNTISSGDATLQAAGINIAFNNATITLTSNTISSGSAPTTWGINNAFSAGTTYTGNTVSVGSCTGSCPQIAIRHAANSGLTMTGNTVNSGVAGASNSSRTALSLENWSGGASSIQRNTFLNQSGAGSPTAVDIPTPNGNQLKFCSNVLSGGARTNAGNATTLRMAQMNAGAGTKFVGNTIIGASVSSGSAVPVNFATNAGYTNFSLDQNIIVGNPASAASTTCITESGAVTYATLALNTLSDCSTLYNENGIIRNSFCSGNFGNGCGALLANPTGLNNLNISPTFVNFAGNDFHLDPATPVAITQGMTSGDLSVFTTSCGNSLDRDGNTRIANSSIGAYK